MKVNSSPQMPGADQSCLVARGMELALEVAPGI